MSTPRPRGRPAKRKSSNADDIREGNEDVTIPTQMPAPDRAPATPRFTTLATPSALRSVNRRTPRGAPLTPFGLRAIQRRSANTPGRDRRRSTRGPQRETAFDVLRNLGRALAPVSKPIQSSPQERTESSESEVENEDETLVLDNEPLLPRPRLSLPIDESGISEDSSLDMAPPRPSLPFDDDDGDITYTSVEYPRRAISEKDRARMSFGNGRLSENFEDLTRLDAFSEPGDLTMLQPGNDEDVDASLQQEAFDAGGETADLGRFNFDFRFPSPVPEPEPLENEGDFALELDQPAVGFASSSDNGDAGDFGDFPVADPEQVSEAGTPGIVGGGLRDERTTRGKKEKKLSRHGIPVPNLPSAVVKKLAMRFARSGNARKAKMNKETLAAVEQASEWFFEQASEDLATYAKHANRRTIDESDVMTLMRRQRHVNNTTSIFSLAQRHLPKELLQDMRLSLPR
ncbi:centromere kinetochore component CENP-T-domain-containing protein [Talaromyces proteolyticus]|uniref:Centromere kinetochore component CENP-T-domain-containing protein n=1 Tax=Talaromyces proteolyticus TaxID=1131652 RepID=A0AAD4L1J4_9EURO|nr:centromere kinetochore component CENP-T-domain-containing protein [Talaromyces proteolyticus]KAH8703830.1 centromere kinetochore component CENP-T-domain-containing protein [Talaromyces proteolyticus]